jgi:hypothetical protein
VSSAPADVEPRLLAELEFVVVAHVTLEDVTRWALGQSPPRVFARARGADEHGEHEAKGPGFDVYVQDEFTHDVVVPYDARGELFLVYDTT